jgi:hypothetical protein
MNRLPFLLVILGCGSLTQLAVKEVDSKRVEVTNLQSGPVVCGLAPEGTSCGSPGVLPGDMAERKCVLPGEVVILPRLPGRMLCCSGVLRCPGQDGLGRGPSGMGSAESW